MPEIIVPQTFYISYKYSNQAKAFGIMTDGMQGLGVWYTNAFELIQEGDADTNTSQPWSPNLPALNEEIWFRWVWADDYNAATLLCSEAEDDGSFGSIFDYSSTCVLSVNLTMCPPTEGLYGDEPTVQFTKNYGEAGEPGNECQGGQITALPHGDSTFENPIWLPTPAGFIISFGIWGPAFGVPQFSDSSMLIQAGYEDSNFGSAGLTMSDNMWEERKVTIMPDFSMRLGDTYYDTADGYASQYGFWSESDDGNQIEITRSAPSEAATGATTFNGILTSTSNNEWGNQCGDYSGHVTKWNGATGQFRLGYADNTPDCITLGSYAGDQGHEFSIPQGFGSGTGTPYEETFFPDGGLKIMKSYDNWMSRLTSTYYLASDGRYQTVGGALNGTYELNKKNETLNFRGMLKAARCKVGETITTHWDLGAAACVGQDECNDTICVYYPEGQELITMDSSGFTFGHMTGTITDTQYANYYTAESGWTYNDPAYSNGVVSTHPIWFDSSIATQGTYADPGVEGDVITYYFNDDLNFITSQKHNEANTVGAGELGPGSYGGGNVRVFYGELCLASEGCDEVYGITGTAHDRYFGYMHHEFYGDDSTCQSALDGTGDACSTLYFRTGTIMSTAEDLNYNNINYSTAASIQYFNPENLCNCISAPEDCASNCSGPNDVCCQGNLLGWVVNEDEWSSMLFWGSEYETVWGCTDPAANNYNSDANFNDASCEYEIPGEVTLVCDANLDNEVNIVDIVVMINWILGVGPTPDGISNLDSNGDSIINVVDIILCINNILAIDSRTSNSDEKYMRDTLRNIPHTGDDIDYLVRLYTELEGKKPVSINRDKILNTNHPVPLIDKVQIRTQQNSDKYFKNLMKKRNSTRRIIQGKM